MNTDKRKILFLFLLLFSLIAVSCGGTEESDSEDGGFLDFTSDTEKAVQFISEANDELQRIKILYAENEAKIEELKEALSKKEIEKVKEISNSMVYVINDGFAFAESAREKIQKAQELNIHPEFKEYLSLKEDSLDKQIEAFKHRHEAARLMRDSFGATEKPEIEKAKQLFKEKEELFQKTMAEAKKISQEADDLAKESLNKS